MARLMHGQQGPKVCIGTLLEPVQLQRHRKRGLHCALRSLARHQQVALVGRQVNGELLIR